MKYTGAELIIHLLEHRGVRIVAGIPGGALLPLYDALGRSSSIRHVLARHEQGAGFIAQGVARVTGRAAVCFATSGPGVTNIATALADAKLDSVPLVCIAGQVPTHLIGTDAFQEVATLAMMQPITKAAFFVDDASQLDQVLSEAFRIAESGRPGPVLIDVPKDVQLQSIHPVAQPLDPPLSPCLPANTQMYDQAAALIAAARRPILYVGGGVVKARAYTLIRQLAERATLPVTTTLMALGVLPAQHELNLGMLGMHGAGYTNLLLEECDLLIAIGARFDDRATGRPDRFVPEAKIIHIDIDPREFGKIKTPSLAIHDDAHRAAAALLERVSSAPRFAWLERIRRLKQSHPLRTPHDDVLCTPYGIVRAVGELVETDAILTTDVGQHQMWVAQAYPFTRPDRWLTSGGLGTMGFGLPAAIGAALAVPAATTICFTGDGSLLMNIQEMATLAELNLNVKIVVLDNGALGLVKQQQELFYRRNCVASTFSMRSNLVAIAQAFGVLAIDLGAHRTPHEALRQTLQSRGPALIRVPIAAEHHVLPMVPPGAANTEAVDSRVLAGSPRRGAAITAERNIL